MIWKIVGNQECGRRDRRHVFETVRVQNILLPPDSRAPKKLAVSHNHVLIPLPPSTIAQLQNKSFSFPGLSWYSQIFDGML